MPQSHQNVRLSPKNMQGNFCEKEVDVIIIIIIYISTALNSVSKRHYIVTIIRLYHNMQESYIIKQVVISLNTLS